MKKILVLIMALALTIMGAVPVAAEKYDGSTPTQHAPNSTTTSTTQTTFDKYLVMDKEAEVPYADFNYEVTAPAESDTAKDDEVYPEVYIAATDGTPKDQNPVVWKGVKPNLVKVYGDTAAGKDQSDELTFTPSDTTTDGKYRANKGDIATSREKYVKKTLTFDFSAIKFAEPGVYRYWLEESNADTYKDLGITYDVNAATANKNWRTLDVYVLDDGDGNLYISDYVWYEGKLTDSAQPSHSANKTITESPWSVEWTDASDSDKKYVYDKNDEWKVMVFNDPDWEDSGDIVNEPPATATGSVTIDGTAYTTWAAAKAAMPEDVTKVKNPNGAEASTPKSSEYVNKYGTADLEFGKKVEGNQGSKDQWFKFKVTLSHEDWNPGTIVPVDMKSVVTNNKDDFYDPTENSATSYTNAVMKAANRKATFNETDQTQYFEVDSTGKIEWELYLQHGQYVQLRGIPYGVSYSVTETDPATGYRKIDGTDYPTGVIEGEIIADNQHKDARTGVIGDTKTPKTYVKHAEGDIWKDGSEFKPLYFGDDGKVYKDQAKTQEWTGDRWFDDDNIYTGVTNKRSGVIPTGLLMSAAGGIALVLIALTLLTLMRRRRLAEED